MSHPGYPRQFFMAFNLRGFDYCTQNRLRIASGIEISTARPGARCWRTHDGDVFGDGDCLIHNVILSIPIVLVEIQDIADDCHWNIPKSLSAYTNNPAVRAHRVVYTIASHLYNNPTQGHFIARYSSDTTRVFDYDGRKHDENAVLNSANMKSLTGLTDSIAGIPAGYHLTAIVYHLDGGEAAQQYFCQEQVRLATQIGLHLDGGSGRTPSSCKLHQTHLHIVSDKDRLSWLPFGSSTIDYIVQPPEKKFNKEDTNTKSFHPPEQHNFGSLSRGFAGAYQKLYSYLCRLIPVDFAQFKSPGQLSSNHYSFSVPDVHLWQNGSVVPPNNLDLVEGRKCLFPDFIFVCVMCQLRRDTPAQDPMLYPDSVWMLPAIVEERTDDTLWMPANFMSAARWEAVDDAPRLRKDQVPEDSPSVNAELSHVFDRADPAISKSLANMVVSNPVIEAYFHDDNYTTLNSIQGMCGGSFEPTPALEAMLALPLAELLEHPLLTDDPPAAHKIFGIGAVFLQLLAIQHSLSER
ncbi:hypothetical protein B0H19DRAFT_1084884 [Mycena capillaripes]|nr:hypothetical protein B0H19DRAFT_1084884 [Mycena capillaripes]